MSVSPRFVKELEFKVIKEDWFVYKLKDGSILKVKPVLIRVFETDQVGPDGKKILAIIGQNVVGVRSPENLKGIPTLPLPSPTDALKLDKEEVEIDEPIYDPQWNIYELENEKKIRTKIVITNVYRIKGKYAETGDPYYVIQSVTMMASSPEREINPSFQMSNHYTFLKYESTDRKYDPLPNLEYKWLNLSELKPPQIKPQEIIKLQEIPVNELMKYLDINEISIKEELKLLLRSYEIPEEFSSKAETMIRDYIKSELEKRGLPTEDWVINPLYKLFVHIAYVMLYV